MPATKFVYKLRQA